MLAILNRFHGARRVYKTPLPEISSVGPVPASPSALQATGSTHRQKTLTWQAPELLADGQPVSVDPVISYNWYVSTVEGEAVYGSGSLVASGTVDGSTLTVNVTGLVEDTYYATVRANNASGGPSEPSFEVTWEGTIPTPVVVNTTAVDFYPADVGTTGTLPLDAPVAVGNSLVIAFLTNGIPTISNVRDEDGNLFTKDFEATLDGVHCEFWRRSNCLNEPEEVTWDSNAPTQFRMYNWDTQDMSSTVDGTDTSSFTGVEAASGEITTTVDDCIMFTVLGRTAATSSRTPTAVSPSVLQRLNVAGGSPYSGPVSEHALHRQCPTAGVNVSQSTWTGEGNTDMRTFSIAYRPAA